MFEIKFSITEEEISKAKKILASDIFDYKIIADVFNDFATSLDVFLNNKLHDIEESNKIYPDYQKI